jgi:hypothetical protein
VRAITEETCVRLDSWLECNKASIQQKLKNFDNPEKGFECLMLKKLMAILTEMENEYKARMTERDLRSYRNLIESSSSELEQNDYRAGNVNSYANQNSNFYANQNSNFNANQNSNFYANQNPNFNAFQNPNAYNDVNVDDYYRNFKNKK